jgi:peroxiredoxin (alkyl hydroperoxide reductase subunit C)
MSCCNEHDQEETTLVPTIQVGKEVPAFTISVYNPVEYAFEELSLKEMRAQKKWLVFFFYPADFTFVCPTELADLAGQYETLQKLGVEVVSMSTDTKFAHMAWRNSERLLADVTYKMGEDPTGDIARHFGIYNEETGLAHRGTFIISPEGILVGAEINFDNVGRNARELVRKLQANVYLADHPNEVCPAKWEQGDKTLTPSAGIVGDIYGALNK